MNNESKDKTAPAKTAKAVVVRVKVLKGGLQIGGSTAAAGTVVNCYQDIAEFHEKRGEVKILGTR